MTSLLGTWKKWTAEEATNMPTVMTSSSIQNFLVLSK